MRRRAFIAGFGSEAAVWPLKARGRIVHHITDEELEQAPTMRELLRRYPSLFDADIFVAHHADFDRRMLVQSGVSERVLPRQTICTMRVGYHLYPDAPEP